MMIFFKVVDETKTREAFQQPLLKRNGLENETSSKQNGHVTSSFSPKLGWKDSSSSSSSFCGDRSGLIQKDRRQLLCNNNNTNNTINANTSDLPPKCQKLIQVSEWPRKDGPLKLSLLGVGGGSGGGGDISDGDICNCGSFGNVTTIASSQYDSLPKSLARYPTHHQDGLSGCGVGKSPSASSTYGTLPKTKFYEIDHNNDTYNNKSGTLITKGISGSRNVTFGTPPTRDCSPPVNYLPRNGLVMYRTCRDDFTQQHHHQHPQHPTSHRGFQQQQQNNFGIIHPGVSFFFFYFLFRLFPPPSPPSFYFINFFFFFFPRWMMCSSKEKGYKCSGRSERECQHHHPHPHQIDSREIRDKNDDALGILLVRLDQLAAECDRAQGQGGGHHINEEKFQVIFFLLFQYQGRVKDEYRKP